MSARLKDRNFWRGYEEARGGKITRPEEHAVAVAVAVAVPFPLPHTPHFSPSTFRDSGLDDFVSVLISYEESMSRSLQLGLWKEAYTRLIILFTYKAHVPASRLLFPSNANPVP